ncbi:hypothetical protein TRFO_14435 [Tritrichomonas foetus]|uniref:Uncharacterized protein n=1 Tax=Tritrichomonas foetus TaxID=1144522 RepID=A0A1J4KVB9_9EUKA|nr:hypothetical protein TRFO_14435 [Tritrichomonas foetus]|eukprot:OHT15090.1 hypothetical protein TRFO_14435 [Tritrichomonas foetus]
MKTFGRDLFSYEFCKCEVKGQIKVKSGKNLMGKCDVNFAGSLGHFDMEEVRHVNTAEGAKRSEAVVTWQHLFQWPNESKGPAKSHHIYPFLVSKNKTHRKKNPAKHSIFYQKIKFKFTFFLNFLLFKIDILKKSMSKHRRNYLLEVKTSKISSNFSSVFRHFISQFLTIER